MTTAVLPRPDVTDLPGQARTCQVYAATLLAPCPNLATTTRPGPVGALPVCPAHR